MTTLILFTFTSCNKDGVHEKDSDSKNLSIDHQKERSAQIKSFIASVTGDGLETRTGPYEPDEFVTATEEAFNYLYAMPFVSYWEIEQKRDTLSFILTDCKVTGRNAEDWYEELLEKVSCRFSCSELNDTELAFARLVPEVISCETLYVAITTVIGSTDVNETLAEEEPDPEELATYKRRFTTALMATNGTCANFSAPVSAPEEMGKMATYNLIGGYDAAHTVVDLQYFGFISEQYVGFHKIDWWRAKCVDDIYDVNDCPEYYEEPCSVWFNSNGGYTTAGLNKFCLQPSTLNNYLGITEAFCQSVADDNNKKFINLNQHWDATLCSYGSNFVWRGNTLTIGNKIYRAEHEPLPQSNCSCS
ncbi:MAG: hypothetical protein IPM42_04845 [Saprospiraceae bacterium]|nr:hypothetical protein [Saprospiraceae bacterium]